ncbi:hypothetical protein NQ314_021445 [Rhamnusium bicolor]|uniref:C2H2-type domain-containing protein n=1 Tax=Rhamnusium bicolor TaxID=1586634 RepID=A0AAV8WI08_9CUCU|nr:hypothetical protein NQ314_021445 [Rhamnusium bicolor]
MSKKPYKCSQCSYACRQSYCLNQHMLQHENDQPKPDKPHRCTVCDRSFTTLAMFTSHCNSQHGNIKSTKDTLIEISAIHGDGIVENLQEFSQ